MMPGMGMQMMNGMGMGMPGAMPMGMQMPCGQMPMGSSLPGMMQGGDPSMMAGAFGGSMPSAMPGLMSGMPGMDTSGLGAVSGLGTMPSPVGLGLAASLGATSQAGLAGTQPGELEAADQKPPEPEVPLDPEVEKFCEHFSIEKEFARRLDVEILKRPDTRAADFSRLYDLLDDMGDPATYLEMKIEEMVRGEFVGDILADREVEALALNFSLADEATEKLNEMVSRRATKKGQDLVRMESILEFADKPSEVAISMVDRLLETCKSDRNAMLPDLGEAQDVIRKYTLNEVAKKKLVDIVLERSDDSSKILGQLEVYFEQFAARNPSQALMELSGRILAGFDVPEEPPANRDRRSSRSRSRGRGRRSRSRDRGGGKRR